MASGPFGLKKIGGFFCENNTLVKVPSQYILWFQGVVLKEKET